MPHIPDFVPGKNVAPKISQTPVNPIGQKKLYLGLIAVLVLLLGAAFFAVGQPVRIAKKAFTPPEQRDDTYNQDVYNLTCPAPNQWYVLSADPTKCAAGADSSIVCGQICPQSRQLLTNGDGDVCCQVPNLTPPVTFLTPPPPGSGTNPPPTATLTPTVTPPPPGEGGDVACFSTCNLATTSPCRNSGLTCADVGGTKRCVKPGVTCNSTDKTCWCSSPVTVTITPPPPGRGTNPPPPSSCPKPPSINLKIFCPLCAG